MINPLSAEEEMRVILEASRLIPQIIQYGISFEDATAVAGNAVTVFFALKKPPKQVEDIFREYSLEEIASLAKELKNWDSWDEGGTNDSYSAAEAIKEEREC